MHRKPEFNHAAAVAMILKTRESLESIGARFGVSAQAVSHVAWERGVDRTVRPSIQSGRPRPMNWPDDRLERLARAVDQSLPAAEIARVINADGGPPVTRNAVLGRIRRLGLSKERTLPDFDLRCRIVKQMRASGVPWERISEAIGEAEGRVANEACAFQWAQRHLPHLIGPMAKRHIKRPARGDRGGP